MEKISFRAMGSRIEAIIASESKNALNALRQVPLWFEEWEQSLSRFRVDSELSLLNRQGGEPVSVSQVLWDVLQISLQAEEESDGLVTPAVLDALESAGYDRSFEQVDAFPYFNDTFHTVPGVEHIGLDASSQLVLLPKGLRLDFGGSAKGWAAHKAAQRLSEIAPALVNAGGDIAVNNRGNHTQAWEIGIADPLIKNGTIAMLRIDRGGVATSGVDYRQWYRQGLNFNHIIDPRTGSSVQNEVLSSTVIAGNLMEAEMAAKETILLGPHEGFQWLNERPGLAGFMVLRDGHYLQTKNMNGFIVRINERELIG